MMKIVAGLSCWLYFISLLFLFSCEVFCSWTENIGTAYPEPDTELVYDTSMPKQAALFYLTPVSPENSPIQIKTRATHVHQIEDLRYSKLLSFSDAAYRNKAGSTYIRMIVTKKDQTLIRRIEKGSSLSQIKETHTSAHALKKALACVEYFPVSFVDSLSGRVFDRVYCWTGLQLLYGVLSDLRNIAPTTHSLLGEITHKQLGKIDIIKGFVDVSEEEGKRFKYIYLKRKKEAPERLRLNNAKILILTLEEKKGISEKIFFINPQLGFLSIPPLKSLQFFSFGPSISLDDHLSSVRLVSISGLVELQEGNIGQIGLVCAMDIEEQTFISCTQLLNSFKILPIAQIGFTKLATSENGYEGSVEVHLIEEDHPYAVSVFQVSFSSDLSFEQIKLHSTELNKKAHNLENLYQIYPLKIDFSESENIIVAHRGTSLKPVLIDCWNFDGQRSVIYTPERGSFFHSVLTHIIGIKANRVEYLKQTPSIFINGNQLLKLSSFQNQLIVEFRNSDISAGSQKHVINIQYPEKHFVQSGFSWNSELEFARGFYSKARLPEFKLSGPYHRSLIGDLQKQTRILSGTEVRYMCLEDLGEVPAVPGVYYPPNQASFKKESLSERNVPLVDNLLNHTSKTFSSYPFSSTPVCNKAFTEVRRNITLMACFCPKQTGKDSNSKEGRSISKLQEVTINVGLRLRLDLFVPALQKYLYFHFKKKGVGQIRLIASQASLFYRKHVYGYAVLMDSQKNQFLYLMHYNLLQKNNSISLVDTIEAKTVDRFEYGNYMLRPEAYRKPPGKEVQKSGSTPVHIVFEYSVGYYVKYIEFSDFDIINRLKPWIFLERVSVVKQSCTIYDKGRVVIGQSIQDPLKDILIIETPQESKVYHSLPGISYIVSLKCIQPWNMVAVIGFTKERKEVIAKITYNPKQPLLLEKELIFTDGNELHNSSIYFLDNQLVSVGRNSSRIYSHQFWDLYYWAKGKKNILVSFKPVSEVGPSQDLKIKTRISTKTQKPVEYSDRTQASLTSKGLYRFHFDPLESFTDHFWKIYADPAQTIPEVKVINRFDPFDWPGLEERRVEFSSYLPHKEMDVYYGNWSIILSKPNYFEPIATILYKEYFIVDLMFFERVDNLCYLFVKVDDGDAYKFGSLVFTLIDGAEILEGVESRFEEYPPMPFSSSNYRVLVFDELEPVVGWLTSKSKGTVNVYVPGCPKYSVFNARFYDILRPFKREEIYFYMLWANFKSSRITVLKIFPSTCKHHRLHIELPQDFPPLSGFYSLTCRAIKAPKNNGRKTKAETSSSMENCSSTINDTIEKSSHSTTKKKQKPLNKQAPSSSSSKRPSQAHVSSSDHFECLISSPSNLFILTVSIPLPQPSSSVSGHKPSSPPHKLSPEIIKIEAFQSYKNMEIEQVVLNREYFLVRGTREISDSLKETSYDAYAVAYYRRRGQRGGLVEGASGYVDEGLNGGQGQQQKQPSSIRGGLTGLDLLKLRISYTASMSLKCLENSDDILVLSPSPLKPEPTFFLIQPPLVISRNLSIASSFPSLRPATLPADPLSPHPPPISSEDPLLSLPLIVLSTLSLPLSLSLDVNMTFNRYRVNEYDRYLIKLLFSSTVLMGLGVLYLALLGKRVIERVARGDCNKGRGKRRKGDDREEPSVWWLMQVQEFNVGFDKMSGILVANDMSEMIAALLEKNGYDEQIDDWKKQFATPIDRKKSIDTLYTQNSQKSQKTAKKSKKMR